MKVKKIIIIVILLAITAIYQTDAYYLTSKDISYSNSDIVSNNVQNALEEIYEKLCPADMKCYVNKSWDRVFPGDYVRMTPTKTSYSIDLSKTGYSTAQTINPSELNLWRVIKVNNDGTVEMVSEYLSSNLVTFFDTTGYANYVGYLNEVAKQYENSAYTIGSRHMGYNGQTEYISDTSAFDGSINGAVFECSSGESCNPDETKGGGDTLYQTDVNLVKTAIGTLNATPVNSTTIKSYWLASRYYLHTNNLMFFPRTVTESNGIGRTNFALRGYYDSNSWKYNYTQSRPVRPIVILKSGLTPANALGTKDDPFILN